MAITILNDLNFFEKIHNPDLDSIVFFYGDYSKACKSILYYLNRIPESNFSGFKVFGCDVDLSPTVRSSEQITIIPSFKIFKSGKVVGVINGFITPEEIIEFLRNERWQN